jgi:hypothetical protein
MNVGTIFESRDTTFFEDIFPMRDIHSMFNLKSDQIHETHLNKGTSRPPPLTRILGTIH